MDQFPNVSSSVFMVGLRQQPEKMAKGKDDQSAVMTSILADRLDASQREAGQKGTVMANIRVRMDHGEVSAGIKKRQPR
jgi:hypothetical protein